MMTRKMKMARDAIEKHIEITGIAPSYEELCELLELKSKSGVHRLILALEERGELYRLPGRARAIRIGPKPASGSLNSMERARWLLVKDAVIEQQRGTISSEDAIVKIRRLVGV